MIIAYVSRSNISVALAVPDFIKSFELSDTDRGTLSSAFFWAYAALQIPAGWVVDRYGVKLPYAFSFLFWCLASAGTALARSVPQLMTLGVMLGLGESVVAPASYRWIRFNFVEKERGLAVGLYMTGTKIGPAVGAPLAAWLIMLYDWRVMFLILGLGGLIWLIPWMMLVKDDDRQLAKEAAKKAGSKPLFYTPCAWSSGGWPVLSLFPPRQKKVFHAAVLDEILQERVSLSRNRVNFRGVKRKMSNYNLRPRKRQRTRRIDVSARIRIVK
jgi:MFS family permease